MAIAPDEIEVQSIAGSDIMANRKTRSRRGGNMDVKSTQRLRLLGFAVLAIFFLFAFPVATALGQIADPYKQALATTLAIGIGFLLLAEVGPAIKSLKAGGLEVEFADTVTDKFNEFEKRITQLELAAARPETTISEVRDRDVAPPPALERRKVRRDDQWKERFGGKAEAKGFKLTAEFKNVGKSTVNIILRVTAPAKEELPDSVDFYLHESFDPDVVPVSFRNGSAELSLLSYGGFTVGAWIASEGVELELDLAELPYAPQIVREN